MKTFNSINLKRVLVLMLAIVVMGGDGMASLSFGTNK